MQEIDRRIVIVKDLFPPVHQALSIIAILAFAARTFWRPPGPHVGLSHVRLGAAWAYGEPHKYFLPYLGTHAVNTLTRRRSLARHWTMRAADACSARALPWAAWEGGPVVVTHHQGDGPGAPLPQFLKPGFQNLERDGCRGFVVFGAIAAGQVAAPGDTMIWTRNGP